MVLVYCSDVRKPYFENRIKADIRIIPKIGYTSICKAYNEAIEESEDDLMVFCHNDIEIYTKDWDIILKRIFDENEELAVLGVVGSNSFSGDSWAGNDCVSLGMLIQEHKYHVKTPHLLIFSPLFINEDYVSSVTIDGMFIAIRKDRIRAKFDENINGFHFYDVCFGVDNYLAGAVVGVTYKLIIRHESDGNYDDSWYKIKNEYIENKYKNILPIKIPCIFAGNTIGIKWKNSIKDKVFKEINNVRQWARINHLR